MQRPRPMAVRRYDWCLLGFLLMVTAARLWYLQQGFLDLSPDEAHYWEWSRRLDWSYYSKGPFVAYVIALSTALGGATQLFVRLPAVLLAAGTTLCIYRWLLALFGDARLALATAVLLHAVPLFAAGALLMTIDAPLVFFWTLMLWWFYRALTEERAIWWYGAGLALGCGLLSKYAMGFLAVSLFLFLATSPRYRKWLWQKEPYIMLALGLGVFSPVIVWNLQHGAVSLKHVMGQAEIHQDLPWQLSLDTFGEFLGSQALAISPLLFAWLLVAMVMSLLTGWRRRDERWLLLFWGWAPTFGIMLLLSLRQKVQANWAAPAYVTALMASTAYCAQCCWWGTGASWRQRLGRASFSLAALLALVMTLAMHDPALFARLGLPARDDPLARLKGWRTLGAAVDTVAAQMPQLPFLLSDRYQISSELAFYTRGQPHTYNVNLGRRLNQYDLWGGLSALAGRDAIYVQPDTPGLPQALQAAFQSCAEGEPVIIAERERELKRFYLFRCTGFSGLRRSQNRCATEMLTILHTEASPGWGGQEIRILTEAEVFAKRGFRVILACQPHAPLAREAQSRGLAVRTIMMRGAMDGLACWQLRRLMRADGVDLVHTHSSVDAWLAGFAAKSLGLPVVRSRHVSIPVKRRRNFVYNALCDRIISSGEAIRQVLIAGGVFPGKIVAIPAGVDTSQFHPQVSGEDVRHEWALHGPVVGTVAMLRHAKGHAVLLRAIPAILAQVPDAVFLWVGDGIGRQVLTQEITQADLGEKIHLTGFRDDVPALLAAMDVVVLPSIKSDGVPQGIIQALAMRKPVIASAVGGIPEVIQHQGTGTLVPPNDASALAAAVVQVLRHPEQARVWAEAGGELVDSCYTLEHMIDRTAEVYTAVLVEKGLV